MKKALIVIVVIAAVLWLAGRFLGGPAPATPKVADSVTVRAVEGGEVIGFRDEAHPAHGWLGIPFAAPADGERRWRAPQPTLSWTGQKEALAAGPLCPQLSSLLSGAAPTGNDANIIGQEDCLYLNVWAPASTSVAGSDLPVMLWIHGGGNSIGHGGSYDGARLAAQENVVVITFNYRLGLFGWFSHEALLTGDPADDSGNYGTLDVVRALEWTRDNVAAFGGNPNNVTLFGESAGGFDTLAMIASPLAKGLFHRAIVQSGGFDVTSLEHARGFAAEGAHPASSAEIVSKLLVARGRAPDAGTARAMQEDMPREELRTLLHEASPSELYALLDDPGGFGMVNVPDNLGDGYVLPMLSNEAIFGDPAKHNQVPTMLGTNRDEPSLFMARDPHHVETTLWIFPKLKDPAKYQRIVKYGALAWKERGVDSIAQQLTSAGNEDVYAYRFDWDEEPSVMGYDLSVALGAAHGLEIAFVFGNFEGGLNLGYLYGDNPANEVLAQTMMGYWAEFARSGDPGKGTRGTDPEWLAWGEQGQRMMVLDTAPTGPAMSDEEITGEMLLAALSTDPEIPSQRERCEVYATAFGFQGFDDEVYSSLGDGGCSAWEADELRGF